MALAKDLKRQQEEDEDQEHPHKVEACYSRVIRIMLYYTRAQATLHATKYYKKCMDVTLPCCGPSHIRAWRNIIVIWQLKVLKKRKNNKIPLIPVRKCQYDPCQ